MTTETRTPAEKPNTPLFIGAGIELTGNIRHAGPGADRGVILGSFSGNVEWNGVLHVPAGGKVIVEKSMFCRELQVSGSIAGASDDVVVEVGLLRMSATAEVDVANVVVPVGGIEQFRGAVLNGKVRMAKESRYAARADTEAQAAVPRLILAASSTGNTAPPDSSIGVDAVTPSGGEQPQAVADADATPLAA